VRRPYLAPITQVMIGGYMQDEQTARSEDLRRVFSLKSSGLVDISQLLAMMMKCCHRHDRVVGGLRRQSVHSGSGARNRRHAYIKSPPRPLTPSGHAIMPYQIVDRRDQHQCGTTAELTAVTVDKVSRGRYGRGTPELTR